MNPHHFVVSVVRLIDDLLAAPAAEQLPIGSSNPFCISQSEALFSRLMTRVLTIINDCCTGSIALKCDSLLLSINIAFSTADAGHYPTLTFHTGVRCHCEA